LRRSVPRELHSRKIAGSAEPQFGEPWGEVGHSKPVEPEWLSGEPRLLSQPLGEKVLLNSRHNIVNNPPRVPLTRFNQINDRLSCDRAFYLASPPSLEANKIMLAASTNIKQRTKALR
jgi:hypothetical protein